MQIEKDIPIPQTRYTSAYTQVMDKLGVGDSVIMNCNNNVIRVLACTLGQKTDRKFTTRTVLVRGEKKTRVWRTS